MFHSQPTHVNEWASLSSWFKEAAAADVRNYIFDAQVCFLCATGDSYSLAYLSLSEFMQQCTALFIFTYWHNLKNWKDREGNIPLFYFLITPPNAHKDSVMFRHHVLLKCGNIFSHQWCGWSAELPLALPHERSSGTILTC